MLQLLGDALLECVKAAHDEVDQLVVRRRRTESDPDAKPCPCIAVDVGTQVRQGQELAVVAMPQEVGGTSLGGAPRMGVTGNADSLVAVQSPLNGIVAARTGRWGMALVGGLAAVAPGFFGLWAPTMETLSLMVVAVAISVVIGVPLAA